MHISNFSRPRPAEAFDEVQQLLQVTRCLLRTNLAILNIKQLYALDVMPFQ